MKEQELTQIISRLEQGGAVQEYFGKSGELVVDKPLPYLCLYRYAEEPNLQLVELVRTQASYLIADREEEILPLVEQIAQLVSKQFNAFMLLELSEETKGRKFKIYYSENQAPATLDSLKESLSGVQQGGRKVGVEVEVGSSGQSSLFSFEEASTQGIFPIGLSIPPIYRSPNQELYPIYFRRLKAHLSDAIKKSVFEFIRVQASSTFSHHLMLGKSSIDSATQEVDSYFSGLLGRIDFLLRVTPLNEKEAWEQFQKSQYTEEPAFHYRLISLDPELEKRRIFKMPMEEIQDPTLAFILREARLELEKKLCMLEEREQPSFRHMGESVYGVPSKQLVATAEQILHNIPAQAPAQPESHPCEEFAQLAQKELDSYQAHFPDLPLKAVIREDMTGLMVSKNQFLVGKTAKINKSRAQALIQHEVGTHVLTYCNGKRQPLKLLSVGLAGYDELQEGLAVLSEYLVGGLNATRLRLLAIRVLAVDMMVKGCSFVECFQELQSFGLSKRRAFGVSVRVYRGGGLPKDAVYLKGLIDLLDYLKEGGDYEVLFAGKFALRHVPLIQELVHRGALREVVLPNHYHDEGYQQRLKKVREGISVEELVNLR